jgi:hypothetical protein
MVVYCYALDLVLSCTISTTCADELELNLPLRILDAPSEAPQCLETGRWEHHSG